jgi:hypothetical protein
MKDYTLGETIDFKFTTCEPDTGAPATLSGTPVISAYVDNSTTQITAGITLTVDFDGVTGLNNVRVAATSGNGYTTGTNVALIITTGTVDSVSAVGYKVAEFSIGRAGTSNVTQISGSAVSTTTAQLGVNVVQVSGDATAADNIETAYDDTAGAVPWMGIIDQGTAQSGSGTTIVLRAGASFGDDTLIGATIHIVSGTGVGQRRLITDWVSATDTATVDTWVTNPDNTSVYKVYASAPASNASTPLDAAGTRAALGLASANLDTQLSGLDGKLDTIDNFLDTEIASIVTSVGTTIPNALTTIDDFLDTEVAAIKAKTDQLTFTVANVLDVNALRINGVAVQGAGTSGNLWRG